VHVDKRTRKAVAEAEAKKVVARAEAKRAKKAVAEAKRAKRVVAVAKAKAKDAHRASPRADANLPDKPRNKVKLII